MDNQQNPPLQQAPDPRGVPTDVFVEGIGATSQTSSEISSEDAHTPTDQPHTNEEQLTPFSGESTLEQSSRVFPVSPNPFDHQANYQPSQSNYQQGGVLGLTQLLGPNFGGLVS
jgi:hypothetical protein